MALYYNLYDHSHPNTGKDFIQRIKTIPQGIRSIDLRCNDFRSKTGDELAEILRALPQEITSIKLRDRYEDEHFL